MTSLTRTGSGFTHASFYANTQTFVPRVEIVHVAGVQVFLAQRDDLEAFYPVLPRGYREHFAVVTAARGEVLLCQCDQGSLVLGKPHRMGVGLRVAVPSACATGFVYKSFALQRRTLFALAARPLAL